ncbi:hypothetical protein [Caldimonas brevitalea]|uniref:hypothetical protein n=1 Tax=Caldimonas brevitalea TaxID=413882 RepID=UPI003AA89C4F
MLDGGSGNDFLVGGAGNDSYVFGRGYGQDTVSSCDATDKLDKVHSALACCLRTCCSAATRPPNPTQATYPRYLPTVPPDASAASGLLRFASCHLPADAEEATGDHAWTSRPTSQSPTTALQT